jgi:peptidyl-prolyl cis-trans isomerase D
VQSLRDKIEDARGNGKSLDEAAKAVGLSVRDFNGVDRDGKTASGASADVYEKDQLLPAVFASDVGVDDEPVATKDGGYVWFSITRIEPAHDRAFAEVKDKVAAAWRDEETAKRLSDAATEAVKKLDGGADIADLAKAAKAEVKTAKDVRREGGGGLSPQVAAAAFGVGPDKAGSVAAPDGRFVFKVTADVIPPPVPGDPQVAGMAGQLKTELGSSVVEQYVDALKRQIGVTIDRSVLKGAEGG